MRSSASPIEGDMLMIKIQDIEWVQGTNTGFNSQQCNKKLANI
jgi:hypothetical protein